MKTAKAVFFGNMKKNYLIEGGSCTGKTTICDALIEKGFHCIHGDRELAYQGDRKTGQRTQTLTHENHIWDIQKVHQIMNEQNHEITFFCGGSRNFEQFIHLFDKVFVLKIDEDTLKERLKTREKGDWGSTLEQQELIIKLNRTQEDVPQNGIEIDATQPIQDVVKDILKLISED